MRLFIFIFLIFISSICYSKDIDISFIVFSYEIELGDKAKAYCKEEEARIEKEGYGIFSKYCNVKEFTEVTLFNKMEKAIHDVKIKVFVTDSYGIKSEVLEKFIGKWKSGDDLRRKDVLIPDSEKTLVEIKSKEGSSSLVLYDKDNLISKKIKCKMKDISNPFIINNNANVFCDSGFNFNLEKHQMLKDPVIFTEEELQGGTSLFDKIFGD